MKKKFKIMDYQISDEIVVYVNIIDKRVSMHAVYGVDELKWVDKDCLIMDTITKKSIPFIDMGLTLLRHQYTKQPLQHTKHDHPYSFFTELYRCNTFSSIGHISIYSTCCHKANSDAYMVCSDPILGTMYMKGRYKDIMIAYQVLLVVCAIAPTELLNKKLKEEKNEKNKLSIRHRKGTHCHSKSK